ncbi:MAG: 3-deoxy-7-phosphoheptulonate synthase [Candidatus Gracilibacteria bacterium]|nr:3-deoxy-7-phosphoheptulonate synthase [Candidatus Gracilibacteria bacterium]
MKKIGKLTQTKVLKKQLHLSKSGKQKVIEARDRLKDIINGKSNRKILIIGPCSADFEESLFEYAAFLKEMKKKYEDKLEIVMRFYTGKPRSTVGWKGILHSEPGQEADLKSGIKHARSIAIKLIEDYDMSLADELLYPELSSRLWDLYSYMAVGARSVEDQLHREVASGLAFPVGMKNPTSGDIKIMNNSVLATKKPSQFVMERVIYNTGGNNEAHGILRGGMNGPNYTQEYIEKSDYPLIVDCNHDNSGKNPEKQIDIMKEVMNFTTSPLPGGDGVGGKVKGFMVESYLYDGRQEYTTGLQKGLSLTDPCIGKENTKIFIDEFYKKLK